MLHDDVTLCTVDVHPRCFVLKLGTWFLCCAAMAVLLADALVITSATYDLGLFLDDDGAELKKISDVLEGIDCSCEDFSLSLVTDDEVDS